MPFIALRYVPLKCTLLKAFMLNGCQILSKTCFCIYSEAHMIFVHYFINVAYCIDWVMDVE